MPATRRASEARSYRFGAYELDCEAGVLLAGGQPLKLQPQPLQVLECLVARAPAVVTREELGAAVWGQRGVHVELDQSLSYCIRQIRQALGDSATVPVYLETLPRQGYRFIAEVERPALPCPEPAPLLVLPVVERAQAEGVRGWRWGLLVAVVLVMAGAAGWAWWRVHAAGAAIRSVAVLPLDDLSGDPAQRYFADGVTDELTTELARIPGLRVVSRTSAARAKATRESLPAMARELGVDAVVEGSAERVGDTVRITARLVDTRNDRNLWGETFEGRTADVLTLQGGIARAIAAQARLAAGPGERAAEAVAVNPVAHEDYLRGLYFYNKRNAVQSAAWFERAIEADPGYAKGYVGLANALESEYTLGNLTLAEATPRGLAMAERAIALDPGDGEAYTVLGSLQTLRFELAAAEPNLRRGLELSPNSSLAEMKYASYLDATGRAEEAVAHMRRALALDPLSFFMNRHLGTTLYFARHYDEALEALSRAAEMEPTRVSLVDNWRANIYENKGMQAEAVRYDLSTLHAESPGLDTGALERVFAMRGWRPYWQARQDASFVHRRACEAYDRGMNAVHQGDRDVAFEQLGRAADERCLWMLWTAVDPMLDSLRGDGRFKGLLQRVSAEAAR